MMIPPEKPKGKLSYCLNCKKDTLTVLKKDSGIFGILGSKTRYCRECGKFKSKTELEQDEER